MPRRLISILMICLVCLLLFAGLSCLSGCSAAPSPKPVQDTTIWISSGDLTYNGEAKSHQELADIFASIERQGTSVLVIFYERRHEKIEKSGLGQAEADELLQMALNLNLHYFMGNLNTIAEDFLANPLYPEFIKLFKDDAYIQSMLADLNKDSNHLVIDR